MTLCLVGILEKAAPVYRARWWPQHNRANLAWIAAATPSVAKYEAALKKELSTAYQTPWPSESTHITISSKNPVDQGALESLFHEASHGMIQKINDALTTELD